LSSLQAIHGKEKLLNILHAIGGKWDTHSLACSCHYHHNQRIPHVKHWFHGKLNLSYVMSIESSITCKYSQFIMSTSGIMASPTPMLLPF
jgi:hypothetical protein